MSAMINKERMLENFLRYVKIDTQAENDNGKIPSTAGQLELAKIVAGQFEEFGLKDIRLESSGILIGTIPSNLPAGKKAPVVGFMGHFDTAPDFSGKDVKARVIKNYDLSRIDYPANPDVCLDPKTDEYLAQCKGQTIITSDGTTLLGGDDKAAIAALLEVADYFRKHPEVKHGDIKIAIITDEEIGVGTERLDVKAFGADVVYTVDGGFFGEIDVESFNGFRGHVKVEGVPAFPGYGKGVYLNAARVLSEFVAAMDEKQWPQNCDGRDPIWWVDELKGGVPTAEVAVYLRNFDYDKIQDQIKELEGIKEKLLKKYPKAKINIDIKESYKNYKSVLDKDSRVVEYAREAVKRVGLEPKNKYVRGGNDSCHLCFQGILSTNIFIGMMKMHSQTEWISLECIEKAAETVIELAKIWAEKA